MTPLGRYVLETIVTLLGVVGLAVVVLYVARRANLGRPGGPLRLVGRLVLDARRAVYLVRVGSTVYVLGASEAGLNKLGEVSSDDLGDLEGDLGLAPRGRAFHAVLERIGARRTPSAPPGSGHEP